MKALILVLFLLPGFGHAEEALFLAGVTYQQATRHLRAEFRDQQVQAPDLSGVLLWFEQPLSGSRLEFELAALSGESNRGSAERRHASMTWAWNSSGDRPVVLHAGTGFGFFTYEARAHGYSLDHASGGELFVHLRLGFSAQLTETYRFLGSWETQESIAAGYSWMGDPVQLAMEYANGPWRVQVGFRQDDWSEGGFLSAGFSF